MIACFGEIMLRLRPASNDLLLKQAGELTVEPGGSESNVAITLTQLGQETTMLTGLGDNALGQKILRYLRAHGVLTDRIAMAKQGRIGLYFTERGCGHRPSRVIYDREGSVYNELSEMVDDLDDWLRDCSWLHLSGIALATSRRAADFALVLTRKAFERGIKISLDVNHRKLLWQWCKQENEPCEYLMKVAELVTLLIGNETDLQTGLFGDASLVEKELVECLTELSVEGNLAWVAASQRESEQADQNRFGGLIYDFQHRMDKPQKYEVKKRTITRIVDRVGTGDAFCGAILDGFIRNIEPTYTLERAVMLGTLMHGIAGDACVIDNDLLERCLSDDSGRILR